MSGYEMATGDWQRKFDSTRYDEFFNGHPDTTRRTTHVTKSQVQPHRTPEAHATPALWIVPAACAVLALLGLFGLPRTTTAIVATIAAAYLAFFGVSLENQANDPRITGGLVGHDWLPAFWGTWVALLAPLVLSHVRTRSEMPSGDETPTPDRTGRFLSSR